MGIAADVEKQNHHEGGTDPSPAEVAAAFAFCRELLPAVSRTFALNILVLPPAVEPAVTVAYLLCRIADTVEDEVRSGAAERSALLTELARLAELPPDAPAADVEIFTRRASEALSPGSSASEAQLLAGFPQVLCALANLPPAERAAITTCLRDMVLGMGEISLRIEARGMPGLLTPTEVLEYCDCVAGTVGTMLTELFRLHVPALEPARELLEARAVSLGRTLQLTNILKDVYTDILRGDCWLPRDILARHGTTPETLLQPEFQAGALATASDLVALAHDEAIQAFEFVILLPRTEKRLRLFCLWPLFTAVLTLRKLRGNPEIFKPLPVKVRRATLRGVIALTRGIATSDWALTIVFRWLIAGLRTGRPSRATRGVR